MLLSDHLIHLIQSYDSALWAANCDEQLQPDLARVAGVVVEDDRSSLTFYLPGIYWTPFLDNLRYTHQLTFMIASVKTFESYQLKGIYVQHRSCTEEEVALQRACIQGFSQAMVQIGLPEEESFRSYYHQPSMAVTMRVESVYEQTPKQGTGEKIAGN